MNKLVCAIIIFVLLISPSAALAFETDQFNLPPEPLADIGAEVSEYVKENVALAMKKINAEIKQRRDCAENRLPKNCDSAAKNRQRLNYLRSGDAVEREVYKLLGSGFPPFTASGSWVESHRFKAQPARYKTDFKTSIYAAFPTNYFTISATVNLFDARFGTDKIAHIFQQGYTYLRIYKRASARGLLKPQAIKKALDWGRKSERTYYGTLVSGVFSNGDLAANYAGFKFYQNLTGEIKIGEATKSPLAVFENDEWKFNETVDLGENLVKPFVSAHLNEALNSSIYTNLFGLRDAVRRHVKKRACAEWKRAFPNFSRGDYEKISNDLQTWNGEDYGFTANKNFVTIANTCFAD